MKLGSIGRINLTLIMLCMSAVLLTSVLGFVPDDRTVRSSTRKELCQSAGANITYLVSKHDYHQINTQLKLFAKHHPDLISVGVRRQDGRLVAEANAHSAQWESGISSQNDGCYEVPIRSAEGEWGVIEFQFTPLYAGANTLFSPALLKMLLVLVPLVGAANWLHLKQVLSYLNPSQVVPMRVRQTLDSFAEGVVLLDSRNRIVLANCVFADHLDEPVEQLLGRGIDEVQWSQEQETSYQLPWMVTREKQESVHGAAVSLCGSDGKIRTIFSVNTSPVLDEKGRFQGSMVVFADVTPLERKRAELMVALDQLNQSKDEICRQNEELRYLATRDPLTDCLNRRTFYEEFSRFWNLVKAEGGSLCAVMVDIDYFKPINDNYGHSMGDEVLRQTGALLNKLSREEDVVCRFGGEEFSVLMPGLTIDQARQAAERIRTEMAKLRFADFSITASLGVSSVSLGAASTEELLDQADKCLYVAKRNGRNRVVSFDSVPTDLVVDESKLSRDPSCQAEEIAAEAMELLTACRTSQAPSASQTASNETHSR